MKQEIQKIDSELGVFSAFSRSNEMAEAFQELTAFGPFFVGMLMLITMMILFLIFSRYIQNRKKEMTLLKVNGLSKKDIVNLILVELICHTFMVSIIAIGFILGIDVYVSNVQNIILENYLALDFLKILVFSFSFMFLPSMISIFVFQRIDVASALRND